MQQLMQLILQVGRFSILVVVVCVVVMLVISLIDGRANDRQSHKDRDPRE